MKNPTELGCRVDSGDVKHQSTSLRKEISNPRRKYSHIMKYWAPEHLLLTKVSLSAVTDESNRMLSQVSPWSGHSHLSPLWIL